MILDLWQRFKLGELFCRHDHKLILLPKLGFKVPERPSQNEIEWAIKSVPRHKSTASYIAYNSNMVTTAAPVKQPTGTAIRTMMQLKAATGIAPRVIEWGSSFDGSGAATPGVVELIETGQVGATVLNTAYAAADIQPYGDPNATANTAGAGGTPFNLGTSASGFATGAVTEGTITSTRMGDIQQIAPTSQYVKQFPLGREWTFGYWGSSQNYMRIRMTFGTTVNAICYVIVEI